MKALIIGLGQVGSATAWLYDRAGWTVHGFDIAPIVMDKRRQGMFPRGDDFGDLRIECPERLDEDYDAVVICVWTPAKDEGYDLQYVRDCVQKFAGRGKNLIIRATMPVGGTRQFVGTAYRTFYVPEIRPVGKMTTDWPLALMGNDGSDETRILPFPFHLQGNPYIFAETFETIEFAKLAINVYLASSISLANALQSAANGLKVDYNPIEGILRHDPRIGKGAFVQAGLGFGGTCLPKDLRAFVHDTKEPLFQAIYNENSLVPILGAIGKIINQYGPLRDKRILVLGATFKPSSDCLTESPALELIERLKRTGCVGVYDPYIKTGPSLTPLEFEEWKKTADLFILTTPHPEFYELWASLPEEKKFCPWSNPFGVI